MLTNVFIQVKFLKNYIKILKNQKWTFINVQNPKNFQIIFFKKSENSTFYTWVLGGLRQLLKVIQQVYKKCNKYFNIYTY